LVGLKYLNKLKRKGHNVFAVDGNHDHYSNQSQGRSIEETERAFYEGLGQNQYHQATPEITLIGANGWYFVDDEPCWADYMNDRWAGSAAMVNYFAQKHATFVEAALVATPHKAIVVTHTAPTMETLNPAYDGHYSNAWYWNPLMGDIMRYYADKILVWCHGHTHAPADKIVDGVRVVCNPRGYPGECPGWAPKTITVMA
jgi:predicted phosphodiesterase